MNEVTAGLALVMAGLLALCAEAGGGPLFGVLAALAAMAGATLLDDDQGQV